MGANHRRGGLTCLAPRCEVAGMDSFRSTLISSLILLLAGACATPSREAALQAQADAFMRAYTDAWNRHDAAVIARDFYRTGRSIEEQATSLESQFASLRAQGYEKSDIHEIRTCLTGADTGWAGMRFTRLKSDGEPLPPKDRASQYDLRWTQAEGWKITRLRGLDAGAPLDCPVSGPSQ
jgi:hypothetical protein